MATLKSIPPTSGDAVTHSPARCVITAHPLSVDQHRIVLETIASRCDALSNLLIQAMDMDERATARMVEAAQALAVYIGSMADAAIRPGGDILGDHDRWNYGPSFATAGKEVLHG